MSYCISNTNSSKENFQNNEIFITGDIHGNGFTRLRNAEKLGCKILIVCGDFGYIWNDLKRNKYNLSIISKIGITILFLDGNHENFDILEQYLISKMFGGDVQMISQNIIHLLRGQVYTIGNKKIFVMGGANSTDKEYMIENNSWWNQEVPNKEERERGILNLKEEGNKINIILTHTAPSNILKIMKNAGHRIDEYTDFLETINNRIEFEQWYFGHMHKDISVDDKHTCVHYKFYDINGKEKI